MRHQGGALFLREIFQTVGGGHRQIIGGGDLRQRLFLFGREKQHGEDRQEAVPRR
ncbi:hypothetical protein D3C72_900490 [compost metagenome]